MDNRAELVAEAKRRLKHTNAEHAMKIKDMEAEFKITMEKNAFQIARIKEKNVHLEKYVGSLVKRKDAVELERARPWTSRGRSKRPRPERKRRWFGRPLCLTWTALAASVADRD